VRIPVLPPLIGAAVSFAIALAGIVVIIVYYA
jgi:hypothetical protein